MSVDSCRRLVRERAVLIYQASLGEGVRVEMMNDVEVNLNLLYDVGRV